MSIQLQENSSELQAMKEVESCIAVAAPQNLYDIILQQFGPILLPQNGADNDHPREQEPQVSLVAAN